MLLQSEVHGQYFFSFLSGKDGRAIPDLSVHITHLEKGKSPQYGFYITDNLGLVSLPDSGFYFVQIQYVGFKTFQDTLYLNHKRPTPYKITLEELQYGLNEVTITGEFQITTTDQSINRIRTIDRKRIERQGAVNLRDLLSNELNIRLNTDPELGTGLSLQGISGQNIKILIDGVPIIGRTDGVIDLTQINLANIERVEIVEGPMSVIYGSDALGGVINLITKKSTSHTFEGGANSYSESIGTYNFDGRAAFRKKGYHGQVSGGRNFFEGFAVGEDQRARTWKPREQVFGDIILGVKYGNTLHRIQSGYFWEKLSNKSEPVFTPQAIYARDAYYYTQRLNNSLFSDVRINPRSTFSSIISYSNYRRVKDSYRKDLVNLTQVPINEMDARDTAIFSLWLFRGTYTYRFNKNLSLQGGYDINLEKGSGERLEGGEQSIQDYAVFTSAEYQVFTRLSLRPGVRFIYNSRYGAPLVPALNLKYDINSWMHLRASYARGFRAPSLKELSLYFVDVNHNIRGNEDLQAEKSNSYMASLVMNAKWLKWNLKFEPSLFRNDLTDMINLAVVNPVIQEYRYVNIDRYTTQGASFTMEARQEGVTVSAGYVLTGRLNPIWQERFIYSSDYRVNASYTIPKILVDLSVFYKYTGVMQGFAMSENEQVIQTRVNPYQTMDITATRNFWKRRVTLVVGAKNIFNVTNINFSGATGGGGAHSGGGGTSVPVNMGRIYFVNLRLNIIQMK